MVSATQVQIGILGDSWQTEGSHDDIISPNQSSFVPQRQITNNIVACQEIIHTLKQRKRRAWGMILKFNLEKAYYGLGWSFVFETLMYVGLPDIIIKIIISFVSSAPFRLLWNGEITNSIQQKSGLRQGDPISPYIFVLCLERLSQWFRRRWKKDARNH